MFYLIYLGFIRKGFEWKEYWKLQRRMPPIKYWTLNNLTNYFMNILLNKPHIIDCLLFTNSMGALTNLRKMSLLFSEHWRNSKFSERWKPRRSFYIWHLRGGIDRRRNMLLAPLAIWWDSDIVVWLYKNIAVRFTILFDAVRFRFTVFILYGTN